MILMYCLCPICLLFSGRLGKHMLGIIILTSLRFCFCLLIFLPQTVKLLAFWLLFLVGAFVFSGTGGTESLD